MTYPVPDVTVYSWGFESFDGTYEASGFDGEEGLDGWALAYPKADPDNYPDGDLVEPGGRTGDYALWNQDGAERVFTGLVPGHKYTFAFWFKHAYDGGGYGQIDITDGDGYESFGSAPAGEWVQWSLTFTATQTSHTIQMMAYHGLTDDITLVHHPLVIIPVPELTPADVLYGDRSTTYRWEVLTHGEDGGDHLVGVLDGVIGKSASLSWDLYSAVKGGGRVQVADLAQAQPGMLRIGELALESVRLRPVCIIDGLPEIPLSVFLISAAVEEWNATGRVWSLDLHDRTTVPQQDCIDESYAVEAGTVILEAVQTVLASAGEHVDIDRSVTLKTSASMVWPAGKSKLTIANDLLSAAGYSALWVDGVGALQASPYVVPAARSIMYEVLGMPRQLVDGEQSIYQPEFQRDRDSYSVPNKVVAVQQAGGRDQEALVGVWTNEDPESPYSHPSRGRWITNVLQSVEVPAYRGVFEDLQDVIDDSARQRALSTSSPSWAENAIELGDAAVAAVAAVTALFPDLTTSTASALDAATDAVPQNTATIIAAASAFETAAASIVAEGADVAPAAIVAFLEQKARASLIAASSVQAQVQVRHLPVPMRVSDVVRFASTPAGIDARHVVTRIELEAHDLGLCRTDLQEVVDL